MALGLSLLLSATVVVGADSTRPARADSTRAPTPKPAAPAAPSAPTTIAKAAGPSADLIAETRQLLKVQNAGRALGPKAKMVSGTLPRVFGAVRSVESLPNVRHNRFLAESPGVKPLVPPAPSFRKRINGRLVADSIVVWKKARKMTLFYRGDSVAVYLVALGKNPEGAKLEQGDNRTPEGIYYIDARNEQSEFHKSLHVSYPSATDRARAAQLGKDPGGDIMIHGLPRQFAFAGDEHRLSDWTKGCIALTNREIEEVFGAVRLGAVIDIRP